MKVDQMPPLEDGKKGFVWVLDPAAIAVGGVESTTRFRKPMANNKRPLTRHEAVVAQRQRSGAKGGRATTRRIQKRRLMRSQYPSFTTPQQEPIVKSEPIVNPVHEHDQQVNIYQQYTQQYALPFSNEPYNANYGPYFASTPSSSVQSPDAIPYNFEDISGCSTGLDNEFLFRDHTAEGAMDEDLLLDWNNNNVFGKQNYGLNFGHYGT